MSTYISDSTIEWNVLATNPEARVTAARDYAAMIFGEAPDAAAWFNRANPAVLEGRCPVAEACKTPDGFIETICELMRLR